MPKLIYAYLVSLDGYVADADGRFDWAVPDEEVLEFLNDLERSVGTYLYGRRIYELMTGWQDYPADDAESPQSAEFARIWRQADKVVFSTTLEVVSTPRTRVERRFDAETVARIAATTDRDLAVSGAELAAAAWRLGLVDEVHVFVAPILVGGGLPMFPDGIRCALQLLDHRRFGNGMTFGRYAVDRPASV